MGRDSDANQTIGRSMVAEIARSQGELEETFARHRKTVNQQGRALEALAEVITAQKRTILQLEARLSALEAPWWGPVWAWAQRTAASGGYRPAEGSHDWIKIEKIADDTNDPILPEHAAGSFGETPTVRPPAPDHVHNYRRESPFLFVCGVAGCGKRSTLEEMQLEADYLKQLDRASGSKH